MPQDTTKLQIPINKEIKKKAELYAIQQGFGSLQDYVRFFITGLSQGKYISSITNMGTNFISTDYENYLQQIENEYKNEIKKGKASNAVKDGKSLIQQLNEN